MSVTTVTRWLKEAKTIDFKGKKISVRDYKKLLKEIKCLNFKSSRGAIWTAITVGQVREPSDMI